MKRAAVVLLLVFILSPALFADYPYGWGIGISGNAGLEGDSGSYGGAMSLKVPDIPIFWNVNAGYFRETADLHTINSFWVGIAGDWLFVHRKLVPDIGLHWYAGVGGWINHYTYIFSYHNNEKYTANSEGVGLRVPIGLSLQPSSSLEIFLQAIPSIGADFRFEGKMNDGHVWHPSGTKFKYTNSSVELGVRIWLRDSWDRYEEFF